MTIHGAIKLCVKKAFQLAKLRCRRAAGRIATPIPASMKLNDLFWYAARHGIPTFVLIDEYDNVAITIPGLPRGGGAQVRMAPLLDTPAGFGVGNR